MKRNGKMRKVWSILLCVLMLTQYVPTYAFATTTAEEGLCEHHTAHTDCGYNAGAACNHEHGEACGYVAAVEEVLCGCTETDESGALEHTVGCGYVAPVAGVDCNHSHDGTCGFVTASSCDYVCASCAEQASASTQYTITVITDELGTVEADRATAAEGETVTFTATPADDYVLDRLVVKQGETGLSYTENDDGTYSFTMPAGNVTITAYFSWYVFYSDAIVYLDLEDGTINDSRVIIENGYYISTPSTGIITMAYNDLPTNVTRTGYSFDGWYTAAEGGNKITGIYGSEINGTVYVYARWTQCTHENNTNTDVYTNNQGGTHNRLCSVCSGVVETAEHSGTATCTLVDGTQHTATWSCCNGSVTETHTGTATYNYYSNTYHTVDYTCCAGTVNEAHTPAENATYTDNGNGTHSYTCTGCDSTVSENHTVNTAGVCQDCGFQYGAFLSYTEVGCEEAQGTEYQRYDSDVTSSLQQIDGFEETEYGWYKDVVLTLLKDGTYSGSDDLTLELQFGFKLNLGGHKLDLGSHRIVYSGGEGLIINGGAITTTADYAITDNNSENGTVVLNGAPTVTASKAAFRLSSPMKVNAALGGQVYTVYMDTPGTFATAGEGITLSADNFKSAVPGYYVTYDAETNTCALTLCSVHTNTDGDSTCSRCGTPLVAGVGEVLYTTFDDALAAWENDTTLKLYADVTGTGTIQISGKSVTLDLNGHTYAFSYNLFRINSGAALTVTDSSAEKKGLLQYNYGSNDYAIYVQGTLTVSGGTITSDAPYNPTVYSSGGTVNISGGTVQNTGGAQSLYLERNTVANISGGTVGRIQCFEAALTVSGGAKIASITMSGTLDLSGATNIEGLKITALNTLTVGTHLILPEGMELRVDGESVTQLNMYKSGTVSHIHTGDTATCTNRAVCSVCESEYGDKNPGNHASDEFTYTANADGATHKKAYKCCGETAVASETHDHTDNKACVCGKKITPAVTAPVAKTDLVYTGSAQALVTAGSATGGTMQYSLDGESWSTQLPAATNAGTYTVHYKVVGDDNYDGTDAQETGVTIKRLDIAKAVISLGDSLTYNGNKQTQTVASVKIGGLTVTGDVSGNSGTDAKDYTLTVTGTGNFVGSATAGWRIAKAKLTITADSKVIYVGEKLPTLTYTVSGLMAGDGLTKVPTLTTSADGDQAGSYVITAANADAGDNYEISYVGGTLTVLNAEAKVETKIEKTGLTEVPDGLKDTQFNTVEAIQEEMVSRIVAASTGFAKENMEHYDVTLQFSLDGGKTWILATEENFPTEGITVVLPYPDGTNARDYEFVVSHMFTVTSQRLGTTAGDVELPKVEETANGLRVTLNGLSPVTVAAKYHDHTGGTATCTDKAICSTCGNAYGELDGTNHAGGTEVKNAKKATCGAEGYTGDTYCKGCNEVVEKGTAIKATGEHTYGDWKVVKEATKTAKGEKQRTCTVCGHVASKEIPMITDAPATGDESNIMLWSGVLCVSTLGLVVLLADRKRRKAAK